MILVRMAGEFSVCRIKDLSDVRWESEYCFLGKTDKELSLVCRKEDAPSDCIKREDGWRGFYIDGILDFSLVGILAEISGILARNGISIFAVSTYNTDYIFVKQSCFDKAMSHLESNGYTIEQ